MKTVLAVDPGREKCGIAIVSELGALHKEIVRRHSTASTVRSLISAYSIDRIIIGNGTGGYKLAEELQAEDLQPSAPGFSRPPIEMVDETLSSQRARARFFQDNPSKGIRRLMPRGLLIPDRPYDDYVAVILAEDYLNRI